MKKNIRNIVFTLGLATASVGCGYQHRLDIPKKEVLRHANSSQFVNVYQTNGGVYADVGGNMKLDAFCDAQGCVLLEPMEDPAALKYLGDGRVINRNDRHARELQTKFEDVAKRAE